MNEQTRWSWLGGYRIIPERFLPKAFGEEREMYISKYYGVTYGGVFAFGLVSLALGTAAYAVSERLLAARREGKQISLSDID